jgi:hypothetical protein
MSSSISTVVLALLTASSHITMKMGPRATRNCVIVNFNRATCIPIDLAASMMYVPVDEMRLSQSLSPDDIAFVPVPGNSRSKQVLLAEGGEYLVPFPRFFGCEDFAQHNN